MEPTRQDEKKYWLDDPRNVTKVYYGLGFVCIAQSVLRLKTTA